MTGVPLGISCSTQMFQSPEYVGVLIAAARRSLRQAVQRCIEPLHVNPPEFWTLLTLDEMSGASLGDLARKQRIDAPAASRTVAALVRRGFVRFQLDRTDRRRSRLSLTRSGEELVRKLRPIADELRARALSGMNPAEEDALRTLLRRVIRNLDAAPRSGR